MGARTKLFRRRGGRRPRPRRYKELVEEIQQRRDRYLFGSLGPASPVRRIDRKWVRPVVCARDRVHRG